MRLPFDPDRAEGGRAEGDAAECLSVSQLARLIGATLERRIVSPLRVVGEVSNLRAPGHWYFSLKDAESVVHCVAWASTAARLRFTPRDGEQVVATGHVGHFARTGRTQLYVSDLEPLGAGALEQRFRAMCDELRRLGYFDETRKRPLPAFPRRVAVITSAQGAAVQDVVSTAAQRCRAVGLVVVDVRVQGDGAARDVAGAVRWVDRHAARLGVEAILITRGGGSMEDLWAFNERPVADAVFRCGLPVVAAIGHESDTTVVELVADLRAATPTQAAMRLVPAASALGQQLDHLETRVRTLAQRGLERQRQRLEAAAGHVLIRDPRRLLAPAVERLAHERRHLRAAVRHRLARATSRLEALAARCRAAPATLMLEPPRRRLAALVERLRGATRRRLEQRERVARLERDLARAGPARLARSREGCEQLVRRLEAVDPRRVLGRGFTITRRGDGRLLRRAADTAPGERLLTELAEGRVESVVSDASEPGRAPPRGRARPEGPGRPQMDLFE